MSTCRNGHPDNRDRWGNCRGCLADASRRYRATQGGRKVARAYEATPERLTSHRARERARKAVVRA